MPLKKEDVDKILTLLRRKYREHLFIERVLDNEEYLSLAGCYINLALIREDNEREREALCPERSAAKTGTFKDERLCSYEEIYEVKKPIAPERIFECQEGDIKDPLKILILGRAGIGKTILCRKLAYEWGKEGSQFWQDKVVFFIQLRELLNYDISSIPSVVRSFCLSGDIDEPSEQVIAEYLRTNRDKCIWILDGYDEITEQAEGEKKQVWRKFFEKISNCGRLIITSRPHAIKQQLAGQGFEFDRRLENMGFTSENIVAYVHKFVKPDTEAEKLLKFLRTNRGLWGIGHIPINLDLICSIGQDRLGTNLTLTKLYQLLVNSLVERHKKTAELSEEKEQHIYNSLHALAYRALQDEKIIIDKDNQSRYLAGCSVSIQELHQTGLIKSTITGAIYFIHLTFQEFCAAKYIANQIINEDSQKQTLLEFIQNEKYNPRYKMVLWFVAGNLYEYWKQSLTRSKEYQLPLTEFFAAIQRFPRDMLGIHHAALLIRLLDECEANEILKDYGSLVQYIFPYVSMWAKYEFIERSPILEGLTISPNLVRKGTIIDILLNKLRDLNSEIRVRAAETLVKLGIGSPKVEAVLLAALRDEDYMVRARAVDALVKLGTGSPEVVTGFLAALRDEDKWLRVRTAEALEKLGIGSPEVLTGLLAALRDEDYMVRAQAADALEKLGTGSPEVLTGLLAALRDEDYMVRAQAADALVKLGTESPEVVTGFLAALRDEDYMIRTRAADALVKLGTESPEVVTGFLAALRDENSMVRARAVDALVKLGTGSPEVVTGFLAALRDEDLMVRIRAAEALEKLGAGSPEVVTGLLAALHDEDLMVRIRAAEALEKLGAGSPEVVTGLLAALHDEDIGARVLAAEVLVKLGPGSPEVVTGLLVALHDEDKWLQFQAAKALVKLGPGSPEVVTGLLVALRDEDKWLQFQAAKALVKLGPEKPEAVTGLLVALRDEDKWFRLQAAKALVKLGTGRPEAVTGLLVALRDEDKWFRLQAAKALVKLGTGRPEAVTGLLAALRDEDSRVRVQAAKALVKLDPGRPEAVTGLLAALRDEDSRVRFQAAEALRKLGPGRPEAVTGLLVALRDEDKWFRLQAAKALVKLGTGRPEAVTGLLAALRDEDSRVRVQAADALEKLGTGSPEVLTGLLAALGDEDNGVRFQAVEALKKLGPGRPEVVDSLLVALHDEDTGVRFQAAEALVKLGTGRPEVLTGLLAALRDEDYMVRVRAADALVKLGTGRPEVLTGLLAALRDEDSRVRVRAADALVKLGTGRPEVLIGFLVALRDEYPRVRVRAAEALENFVIYPLSLSSLPHSNNPQLLESISKLMQEQQLPTTVLDDYIKLLKGDQTMIESSVHQSVNGATTSSAAAISPQSGSEDVRFNLTMNLPELNGRLLPEHFGSFSPSEWSLEGMDGLEPLNEIPQRSLAIFLESLSNPNEPNRIHLVREALATCPDLSRVKDRYGNTLLHFCALLGDIELANLLLDGSVTAAIDVQNNEGFTPLHFAVYNGKEDIVKYFISKGTNVALRVQIDLKRKPDDALCECNSLHLAILGGQLSMIDYLLEAYPSIELLEASLGTILHLAILCGQNQSLKKLLHHPQIRELCNQRQGNEYTPLDLAANIGNIGAIEILCEFGKASQATVDLVDRSNPKGQTPLHYAVLTTQVEAVKRLASYYQLPDLSRQLIGEGRFTALQLAEKKMKEIQKQSKVAGQDKELLKIIWTSYREICTFLDNVQKQKEARQYTMPDFTQIRVRNLVFRGGGPKGIAYIGALSALSEELKKAHRSLEGQESKDFLPDVKRVGGTSAGAIIALLVALNFDPTEIEEVLASLDLTSFLDDIDLQALAKQGQAMLSQLKEQKGLLSKIINGLKLVWRMAQTRPGQSFWSFLRPDRQFKELFDQLYNFEGLCSGEAFKRKIEEVILNKLTKDKVTIEQDGRSIPFTGNLTFGLLKKLIASGRYGYKHLYIVTTRLGSDEKNPPKIEIFNTEESDISDSVSISDAVRASMSIPGVFKPHEITINVPGSGIVTHKYVDGGLIQNYPITIFDRAKYVITHFYGHQNRDYPYFNEETLGFSLHTKAHYYLASVEQETQLKDIQLQVGKIIVRVGKPERYSYYCCERTALGLLESHFQLSVPKTSDLYNRLPFPDIGAAPILLPNDSEFMDGIFESILYTHRQGQDSSVISLIREVINVYSHAERLMADLRSCDEHRTISIDDCGVMTTDFDLDTTRKDALKDSGRDTVMRFFERFNPTYRRRPAPETTSAPAPSPTAALPVATVADSRTHSKTHSPHSYFWAYCNDPTHAPGPWHGERGHKLQRHAQRELDQEHQGHKESRVVETKTKSWS